GRVLFRNTRQAIKGFPERLPLPSPLPPPPEYLSLEINASDSPQWLLSPEIAWQEHREAPAAHWTQIDPRLDWLKNQLLSIRPEKVLVITSSRQTAMEIAELLRLKAGILAAAFHEGLSIIERDRAAAYFADTEAGAQVLVCSEIGSEGRNFQFAHHLVLFDLPLNPDLLEQRIGRLDRIGQKYPVKIHVPYMEGTPQALMYHWYDQGLKAFNRPCHTGAAVFDQVSQELLAALRHMDSDPAELIQRSAGIHAGLNEALEKGRDRLLEYNSCRPVVAERLLQSARKEDQTSNLPAYMDRVFDSFGVHSEEHSTGSLILTPAENMLTAFPHLPEDGLTITFSRQIALANEDRQFLTWSHPMVISAMDLILSNELGNTAVAAFKHPQYAPGTLLVECNYLIDSASSHGLEISKHLPPTLLRIVIDERGTNHATVLQQELIENSLTQIDRQTAKKIIKLKQTEIKQQLDKSNALASRLTPELVSGIRREAVSTLESEINRLRELARVNPNIRREEIEYFEHRLLQTEKMLDSALPRLDAVRVLVAA
ncbi:MAG: RNA polymerase-associated protein RapA, partial [Gammaproteobacteria bacterium]